MFAVEQAKQFLGQISQLPFDKYRPASQVIQDYVVDYEQVKHFAVV